MYLSGLVLAFSGLAFVAAAPRTTCKNTCKNAPVQGTRCRVECGVDYPGGDYASRKVASFQECVAACDQDSRCVDAQFHKENGYCYLKDRLTFASKMKNVDSIVCDAKVTTTKGTTTTTSTTMEPTTGVTTTTTPTTTTETPTVTVTTMTIPTTTTTTTTTPTITTITIPTTTTIPTIITITIPTATTATTTTTATTPTTTTTTTPSTTLPPSTTTTTTTTTAAPAPTCINGPTVDADGCIYNIVCNSTFNDFDLETETIAGLTQFQCEQACSIDQPCNSFSYSINDGFCTLYAASPGSPIPFPGSLTGTSINCGVQLG